MTEGNKKGNGNNLQKADILYNDVIELVGAASSERFSYKVQGTGVPMQLITKP